MDAKKRIRVMRERTAMLIGLALGVALLAAGCDPAVIDWSLVTPTHILGPHAAEHPVEAHLSAEPGRVCPGELVQVEWDGGTDMPECEDDSHYCKQVQLTSTGDILESTALSGSQRVVVDRPTTFRLSVLRAGELATDSAYVDVMTEDDVVAITYTEECIAGRWQWVRQSPPLGPSTACMSITQVCANWEPGTWVYVMKANGVAAPVPSNTCVDVFNGTVGDFRAMDATELESGRGACSDASTGPGPESVPREPIELVVTIACPGPGVPPPEDCEMATAAALTSQPGGEAGTGLATICDLEQTCGDGVCDQPCEDAGVCAEDCQPAGEGVQPQAGPPVCGDGTLSPEEECEADTDCAQGYFCGDPGTNAPCLCVSLTTSQEPDVAVPADENCEIFEVYDCTWDGGSTWTWYRGKRCYAPDGTQTFDGRISEAFTGNVWQPFCPGPKDSGDSDSDGGGPPSCQYDPQDPNCVP